MARTVKPRTITLSDETFEGLRAYVKFQRLKFDKKDSVSAILERLALQFISEHSDEIQTVLEADEAAREARENIYTQKSLFDDRQQEIEE